MSGANGLLYMVSPIYRLNQSKVYKWRKVCLAEMVDIELDVKRHICCQKRKLEIQLAFLLLAANLANGCLGLLRNSLLYVVSLIYRLNQSKVYMCIPVLLWYQIIARTRFGLQHDISECRFFNYERVCCFAEIRGKM